MSSTPEQDFGIRFPTRRYETQRKPKEPLSVGVPLTKLIKRSMLLAPELVMLSQPRSLAAEEFRRLKTLLINHYQESCQVIVVTSATPGEGKSTVSINLALAFAAEKSETTLLLDGDLRRPTIGQALQPRPQLGLGELLSGRTVLEHTIISLENSDLDVLPAGDGGPDPLELLASEEARALMATLRQRYRRIIIDTPPIVPFTDADALGSLSDGVLMVVRKGVTPQAAHLRAVSAVTSTRVLGTVLNDVTRSLADWDRYSGDYYYRYYDKERGQ